MWSAQTAELKSRHRLITPDLRGFGQSFSDAPFTVESMADDVHELLTSINALPCILGGLSMGGYVAMFHARKYPADLKGLMLIDTRSESDSAAGKATRDRMIGLMREKGTPTVAAMMLPKMLAPDAAQRRPQLARAVREMMEACPAETVARALVALRDRPDQTSALGGINTPTLIIVGEADQITPPDVARGMQSRIAGSRLVLIQGAGHMSPMEQPGQVNRAIEKFARAIEK